MDQPRSYRFYTKRSEHYNNLEKQEAELNKSVCGSKAFISTSDSKSESGKPLKDNTNIQKVTESGLTAGTDNTFSLNKVLSPQNNILSNLKEKRPLKCLETLAEKAGISLDDKPQSPATLDKPQSPAQGGAAQQQVPFQISHEQLQQMQLQFQQPFNTIQVKQEYPNQQTNATHLTEQQMQVLESQTQGQHQVPTSMALNQTGTTTINTLSPLQAMSGQVPAEWQNRVQVLPQTIQNAPYLQQLYTGQQPIVMTGNVIPGLAGQQQIQLIASGKPFQGSPMGAQQMLTNSQGKQVISGAGAFSGTYTLPTIPSSQSQTLVLNMISAQNQQGQNVMSSVNAAQNTNKPLNASEQMQKQLAASQKMMKSGQQTNVNQNAAQSQQCVQMPSTMQPTQLLSPLQQAGQTMQFATPWTCQMPFWTANGLQSQILPSNSIFIQRTNPDGTPVFIQQTPNPQQTVQQAQAQNQTITQLQCGIAQQKPVRAINESNTPKQIARAPTLLPQGTTPPIRPASSVSTQTAQGTNAGILTPKTGKVRTNKHTIRPPGPLIKQDLGQGKVNNNSQLQQVITSTGNKMVVMSTGIGISNAGQIQQTTDKQQQFLQYQQMVKNQQAQIQQKELQQQFVLQMQNQSPSQQQQQQQQQLNQNNLGQFPLQMQGQSPSLQQVNQSNMGQFQLTATSQAQSVVQNALLQGQPQGLVLQGQQMVLHNQNGQPTLTMAPSNLLTHQTSNSAIPQQQLNIQPKPVNQNSIGTGQFEKVTMPIVSSSVSSSVAQSTQGGNMLGQMSSPQTHIQPPQNPLLAMTNLSTSPLSVISSVNTPQKDNFEQRSSVPAGLIQQNPSVQNNVNESNNSVQNNMSPIKVNVPKMSSEGKNESLSAIIGSCEPPSETEKSDNRSSVSTPIPTTPVSLQSLSGSLTKTTLTTTTNLSSSLNGISSAGVNISSNKNEKGLPKAMVKPNVLTHVIEGFVIQESQEPFPVNRQRYSERDEDDEPPKKKSLTVAEPEQSATVEKVACAQCGKLELKTKLKKKKYCSFNCSKLIKTEEDSHTGVEETKNSTFNAAPCETLENGNNADDTLSKTEHPNNPIAKWSSKEVCTFIADVLGTEEYSEDFTTQEIDGSALILLKEKHLVNAMGMKLGPALKIVAKVQSLMSLDAEANVQQSPSTTTANQ